MKLWKALEFEGILPTLERQYVHSMLEREVIQRKS
jgi:hypothetical protein